MADFLTALGPTLTTEGGYANDPNDRGGETYAGVSRKANPGWAGWERIDLIKKSTPAAKWDKTMMADVLLTKQVQSLYQQNYWDINNLNGLISQALGSEVFDNGVNMGVGKASRMLQEALNLTNNNGASYPDIAVDGVVGPTTLKLANEHPRPKLLLNVVNALQAEHYLNLVRANRSQEVFMNSWFSRVNVGK